MQPFRRFRNVPAPRTADQMAADLAAETCRRLQALRAEALAAEQRADEPMRESAEQAECYTTLDALLRGRHRRVVVPVLLEHFPELLRPQTAQERAAVEAYLAQQCLASDAPVRH